MEWIFLLMGIALIVQGTLGVNMESLANGSGDLLISGSIIILLTSILREIKYPSSRK